MQQMFQTKRRKATRMIPMAQTESSETRTPRKRGRGADPEQTRAALLDAAFDSLRHDGFRATTARSIATRADCNQAAIYYHFGGIDELLVETLTRSSHRRLDRYREALAGVDDLPPLLQLLQELYAEDTSSGHMAVLTELAGGVTANPSLRDGIERATEGWLEFVESKITEVAEAMNLGALAPAAPDVADLLFSLVVGVELRNRIDGRDDRGERAFRLGQLAVMLAGQVIPATTDES